MHEMARVWAAAFACGVLIFALPATGADVAGKLITAAEKEIIRHYFATGTKSTGGQAASGKKGKSKDQGAKQMPQGTAMKLERGGMMPPGIERTRFPSDLLRQLPNRPAGQESGIVGNDVVLIEIATGLILDILTDGARK